MKNRRQVFATLFLFGYLHFCVASSDHEETKKIPSDFRFITYSELMNEIPVFHNDAVEGFVQLNIDADREQVIVGAKDCLFRLSLDSLRELEMAKWKSNVNTTEDCKTKKGQSLEDCHNFIKVVIVHNDQVFVCGTNAFKPECTWRKAENLGVIVKENNRESIDGVAICPYNPYHNSTAIMTNNGDVYSATVIDINARDPAIYRAMGPSKPLRTKQSNSRWLNEPNFVSSYEIDDFVYFFFREAAIEYINCGKRIFSRVARVCKSDKGGNFFLENTWTTFLKARLNCSMPGDFPFYFDELQHTFFSNHSQLLYAVFTTPPNSMAGSAVCVFNMSAFHNVFTGSFKYSENSQSAWLRRENPSPQDACPSPGNSIKRSFFDDQSVNMMHTAQQYQLMDQAVQPVNESPEIMAENERWTHVAVDHVHGKHHKSFDILFVATDTGLIKKMLQLPNSSHACLLEEIKIVPNGDTKPVKAMKFSADKAALYVVTLKRVLKIPVQRCHRFTESDLCMNAMDPYCGWNSLTRSCTTAPGGKPGVHYWNQHIESCPEVRHPINGGWSQWTDWSTCQQAGTGGVAVGDQCYCRTRFCNSPEPYYGGRPCIGHSVEVTNCTVDGGWTDWSEWSSCSVSCGTAIRTRRRQCGNPPPKFGGRTCLGSDRSEEYCPGNPPCPLPPIHGNWSLWTAWSECTSECNGGIQTRRRGCDDPPVGRHGIPCVGNRQEWRMCNPQLCKEKQRIVPWSPWVKTNETRGGYFEQRFRFTCRANVPNPKMIKASHAKSQVRFCFDDGRGCYKADDPIIQDVDGAWSSWSSWSECTKECDSGVQYHKRRCDNPKPFGNGTDCQGVFMEAQVCNSHTCQGYWTSWSEYSPCSVTCGRGNQLRVRRCISSPSSDTNFIYPCIGDNKDMLECTLSPCEGSEGWYSWSPWSECNSDLLQYRRRSCSMEEQTVDYCQGKWSEFRNCTQIEVNLAASMMSQDKTVNFKIVHVIGVGLICFILGCAAAVGLVLYTQRHLARSRMKKEAKNNMEKNEKNKILNRESRQLSIDFTKINNQLSNSDLAKMTVGEATLKRNSTKQRNSFVIE